MSLRLFRETIKQLHFEWRRRQKQERTKVKPTANDDEIWDEAQPEKN